MRNLRWALSYIFMSAAAIVVALYLTSAVMGRSYAQVPPTADAGPANPPSQENKKEASPLAPSVAEAPSSVPASSTTSPAKAAPQNPPTPVKISTSLPASGSAPAVNPNQVPKALLDESAPLEQTAAPNSQEDFVFDSAGLRDPFKPFKAVKPPSDRPAVNISQKPLENFDPMQSLEIETLELVAVLWDVKNPRALVKTKTGQTYTLKRDTKIGRNNGVVAGIREGEVIVLETVEEDGRPFKQYKTIKMVTVESKINKVSN